MSAYFLRTGPLSFRATEQVGGAWDATTQHIAPVIGLMAHVVELDRDQRRDDHLVIARLSYDILGTLAIDEVDVSLRVLRPGRSIELVEATLTQSDRAAVVLRAWLMQQYNTDDIAGSAFDAMPSRDTMQQWSPSTVWPGGFIASLESHRDLERPGRGRTWLRSATPLVAGEQASAFARFVTLLDVSNGSAVRVRPEQLSFPNLDLTAHFFREPGGDWVGLDTTVSFGERGIGLTNTVLHDEQGPVGACSQILTLRAT